MKKFLICLILLFMSISSSYADNIQKISYQNIKPESKIKIINDVWSDNVSRKDSDYFIKFISDGTGNYSEFYNSDGTYAFNTGCQYEFLYKGDLIGYSNQDLKFYDFTYVNGELFPRELTESEVAELFPDYEIIKISEFSSNTNSLKIKKNHHVLKIILLNDTDRNFYHYSFSTGNGKFERYPLSGFVNVTKKGMFQFSHFGDNTKENPWYVLLVR